MMNKWYRGYIWVAIVMLIPALVRMGSAPTVIDAVFFYLISIVVWGSVLSLILYAWSKFRSGAPSE